MKVSKPSRYALCVSIAGAMLAGCGGSQPSGAMPQDAGTIGPVSHGKSWMLPETKTDTLLYYSDGISSVYVVSYPGGKLVGTLTGFDGSQGVCSDASGDVFVTTYSTEDILEYAHGGTQPIAKLGDYGYYPLGCAVDPLTGNLAVANTAAMNGKPGNVAIYAGARGKPTDYTAFGISTYDWCAYDNSGNLYVSTMQPGYDAGLAEMPYGSQSFTDVSLDVTGAGIHWDGQYLAMVNPTSKVIYRISVSGSAGTVVGTVNFSGLFSLLGNDFALSGSDVVMPYGGGTRHRVSRIGLWRYPKGGKLQRSIHRVDFFSDLTLSV